MSFAATNTSACRRAAAASGLIAGRQLGSKLVVACSRAASTRARVACSPGGSTVAIDPVWTWVELLTAARAGTDAPLIAQVIEKAYSAAPSDPRVARAVDVAVLPPLITWTAFACRC